MWTIALVLLGGLGFLLLCLIYNDKCPKCNRTGALEETEVSSEGDVIETKCMYCGYRGVRLPYYSDDPSDYGP